MAQIPPWKRLFSAIRTRVLVWYVLLMTVSTLVSIFAIRQILLARLHERIDQSLEQEVQEFEQLVDGRDPETGQPFGNDIGAIFTVFLRRNIPGNDEFLLTILNGEFYRSSPSAVPEVLKPTGKFVQSITQITTSEQAWITDSTGETIIYRARPIVRGRNHGVFVVVHLLSSGEAEINDAIRVIVNVTLVVLGIASALAWAAAKRAMAPLSILTEAVRTISESDLTRRIPIQGVDEISELTLRFNEMLDRLETAFASQRNFISDAGHELRTPITIIRGNLELLSDDPHEQKETLALVTDELDRMSRLVSDLLLLAKAEHQSFLQLDIVDVGALTDELFAKAKALADRTWCLEATGRGRIVADRQRLTQAMMNLAQNATQHTNPGDRIVMGSSVYQGNAMFWVQDSGDGIVWTDQQRIFERFARTSNSQRRSEGAGLGLAIVKAIAQAHNGRIELVSQPGEGSIFTLIIPVDPI